MEYNFDQVFILDTNILLEDFDNLVCLSAGGENLIVIPEVVLEEIDNKKKGFDDLNFQARNFVRFLSNFKTEEHCSFFLGGSNKFDDGQLSVSRLSYGNIKIEVISKDAYTNKSNVNLNIQNDNNILELAFFYTKWLSGPIKYTNPCTFLTNDIALKIKAEVINLKSDSLRKNRVDDIDSIQDSFVHTFIISPEEDFNIFDNRNSSKLDKFKEGLSNFSSCEFVFEATGRVVLAFYKMNTFNFLDEKFLRKLPVVPRNKEQLFFMNLLLDKDVPIVVCSGVTGSGKNLLTTAAAIEYQGKNKEDIPIKYCRNSVVAGDVASQLGFLKGDENAKLSVFSYPLYDSISSYMKILFDKNIEKNSKSLVLTDKDFVEDHNISVININQMRGVNLSGFLIFDEWQNSSNSVNKLMLTRVCEGSKVVILGDLNQIDHPHLSKKNNALATMMEKAKSSDIIGAINLKKVLRGIVADFADKHL